MVIAEFETATHVRSQHESAFVASNSTYKLTLAILSQKKNDVVIWDKIITSKSGCILNLPKESPEYSLNDDAADLRYDEFYFLSMPLN